MGLSDWDMLAFGTDGKPSNGVIEGFVEGASCEIYKNWLYVHDGAMWVDNRSYLEPTIAEIHQGVLALSDFSIVAVRGPQAAIFVVVTSTRFHKPIEGEPYRPPDVRRMAGIGCSGCIDKYEKVMEEEGLDPAEWEPSGLGSTCGTDGIKTLDFFFVEKSSNGAVEKKYTRPCIPGYDTEWVGVLPTTYQAFLEWLRSEDHDQYDETFRAWVDKIASAEPLRFNQGDAFFSTRAGLGLSATSPGEADVPLVAHLLSGMAPQPEGSEEE